MVKNPIREIREKMGLSVTSFGKMVGCSYKTIQRVEAGIPSSLGHNLKAGLKTIKRDPTSIEYRYKRWRNAHGTEIEFQKIRNKKLMGKCGIYVILNENLECIFCGSGTNLYYHINYMFEKHMPWNTDAVCYSYSIIESVSDMRVYKPYYIEKLNPLHNIRQQPNRNLTIELPELTFSPPIDIYDGTYIVDQSWKPDMQTTEKIVITSDDIPREKLSELAKLLEMWREKDESNPSN